MYIGTKKWIVSVDNIELIETFSNTYIISIQTKANSTLTIPLSNHLAYEEERKRLLRALSQHAYDAGYIHMIPDENFYDDTYENDDE